MAQPDSPVALAVIIGAQGVMGEVRLKLFTDDLNNLKSYDSFNGGKLTLKSIRDHKAGAVARFHEITDRNAAEAARGTEITIARTNMPELGDDEYYYADIIGLPCKSSAGEDLGKIIAIYDYGAGDVFEIARVNGKKFMVPSTAADISDDSVSFDASYAEV